MRTITFIIIFFTILNSYSQENSIVLELCNLEPISFELSEERYVDVLEKKFGNGIEGWNDKDYELIYSGLHPFIQALHNSYAYHQNFTITPDMIWLLIAQGFSTHINQNPEKLRKYFVDFNGKKALHIRRDKFSKGSIKNDWTTVFPEFTEQIGEYTGKELLNTTLLNFSTTTSAEKIAFEITLMEAMNNYFIYVVHTRCGIPNIILKGKTSDWELILEKTKELSKYELNWWVDDLIPILEQFINASKNQIDLEFWNNIYKNRKIGSGSPYITGWITKFFPYLKDRSEKLIKSTDYTDKITTKSFTSGIAKADFYWDYNGAIFQMEFLAGFVGYRFDKSQKGFIPEIGWVVRDTGEMGIKNEDSEYKDEILQIEKN